MYRVTLACEGSTTVDREFCTRSFATALHVAGIYNRETRVEQVVEVTSLAGPLTDDERKDVAKALGKTGAAESGREPRDAS